VGWIWQHGMRWVASQLASEARRASSSASEEASQDPASESDEPLKISQTTAAFLCESKLLFDAVADELSGKQHVRAHRMALCHGKLEGKRVVVARPVSETPDLKQFVSAVIEGHAPRFALSISEATSLRERIEPGTIVMASRVFATCGKSLRIDGQTPIGKGLVRGGVSTPGYQKSEELADSTDAPLAEDKWSEPIARVCGELSLPLMVAAVVLRPPAECRTGEADKYKRQRSWAGKSGVLVGLVWKNHTGLGELWNEKEARWSSSVQLAKLARMLVKSIV
jgi:hypothetical protein